MACPENHYTRAEVAVQLGYSSVEDMSAFLKTPSIKRTFRMAWTPGGHYLPKDDAGMLALRDKRIKLGAMPAAPEVVEEALPAAPEVTDVVAVEVLPPAAPEVKEGSNAVDEFMVADLAKSGLVASDLFAKAAPPKGYAIPFFYPDGNLIPGMYRLRLTPKAAENMGRKYTQPSKREIGDLASHPYFPRGWNHYISDGVLNIHEGEKKTVCAMKHAKQAAIGIGGCNNWGDPAIKSAVHPAILSAIKDNNVKTVRLWPDGDIKKAAVQMGWGGLARELSHHGVSTVMMDISGLGEDAKFDDVVAAHGIDYLLAGVKVATIDSLTVSHAELVRQVPGLVFTTKTNADGDEYKVLRPIEHNLMAILRRYPAFAGQLWFNEDRMAMMFGDEPWVDNLTETQMLSYFQSNLGFNKDKATADKGKVRTAMLAVAMENRRSPFREYLQGLQWDGVPRLEGWLVRYCHADNHPVVREAGKRWLVGLVHRQFEPGCYHRWMPVFLGPQKIGKSGIGNALVGQDNCSVFGTDDDSKDEKMLIHSAIVNLWDEMAGYRSRADLEHQKSLIAQAHDTFRPPYGTRIEKHLRRSVMFGTANPDDASGGILNHDPSGNNRYVVIPVARKFDFAGLAEARDQLFAEAVALMRDGYEHAEVPNADDYAKQFEKESPYLEPLINGLTKCLIVPIVVPKSKDDVTPSGIVALKMHAVCEMLGLPIDSPEKTRKVGQALRKLGFTDARTPASLGGIGNIWKIQKTVFDETIMGKKPEVAAPVDTTGLQPNSMKAFMDSIGVGK